MRHSHSDLISLVNMGLTLDKKLLLLLLYIPLPLISTPTHLWVLPTKDYALRNLLVSKVPQDSLVVLEIQTRRAAPLRFLKKKIRFSKVYC